MKVTYDPAVDAAYLYLVEEIKPGGAKRTHAVPHHGIMLDFDEEDRLIGIEVLAATKRLPEVLIALAEKPAERSPSDEMMQSWLDEARNAGLSYQSQLFVIGVVFGQRSRIEELEGCLQKGLRRLEPLCALDLPLHALVGYRDAQRGLHANPFLLESASAREWAQGHDLAVKEGTAKV